MPTAHNAVAGTGAELSAAGTVFGSHLLDLKTKEGEEKFTLF